MPSACHIPTIVALTEQEQDITTDKAAGENTPQVCRTSIGVKG